MRKNRLVYGVHFRNIRSIFDRFVSRVIYGGERCAPAERICVGLRNALAENNVFKCGHALERLSRHLAYTCTDNNMLDLLLILCPGTVFVILDRTRLVITASV